MEEHIFGTYATDALKLVHHRAMRRGLQHWHDLTPQDPAPGQPVTLTVRAGPDLAVDQAACYYTLDGSPPAGSRGRASSGQAIPLRRVAVEWDSLVWGYVTAWQGELPAQPEGAVVRYRISAWSEDGPEVFADWPDARQTVEKTAEAFFHNRPQPEGTPGDPATGTTFTYHVDRLGPPTWAREAVIYEIFVDRFYPGDGQDWLQTQDLSRFCGGTLWGVRDKLDYLADLGVTCVWLTPIFPSPTPHGYDATDYFHVAPRLGGDEALRALVQAAHAHGIRIILDLACNHLSDQHPIFQQALSNPDSPYRDWFTWDDSAVGYRSFFGVRQMPQLNLAHPDARRWMIEIGQHWLREFDVDGYRLDYANGPGPDFWADFWAACKATRPDCFCFGEIVDAPDALRAYIGRLDGSLDFHLEDALRRTYALKQWSEADFERFLARHLAYFPPDFIMPTFLDNHDMNRFLYVAGGDKAALRRAAAVQMRLPGPPVIYYGTEVGLSQTQGRAGIGLEVSRTPMIWGAEQDRDLLAYYQALIRQRRARGQGGG